MEAKTYVIKCKARKQNKSLIIVETEEFLTLKIVLNHERLGARTTEITVPRKKFPFEIVRFRKNRAFVPAGYYAKKLKKVFSDL